MSDSYVEFIPVDPRYVPSQDAQHAAVALLRKAGLVRYTADISSETEQHIVFRDAGANFERVLCPSCGGDIPIETWQDWMNADYSAMAGFALRPVVTTCCATVATLNDLVYDWPQAFGRYALTLRNSDDSRATSVVAELERTLDCKLRTIRRHI